MSVGMSNTAVRSADGTRIALAGLRRRPAVGGGPRRAVRSHRVDVVWRLRWRRVEACR